MHCEVCRFDRVREIRYYCRVRKERKFLALGTAHHSSTQLNPHIIRRNNMGILRPGRPSAQNPPKDMGLYRSVGPEGAIKYIGSANNLSSRISAQIRSGAKVSPSDTVVWQAAKPGTTIQEVRTHEAAKIAQHNPPLNLRAGGGGRLPKT